MSTETQIQDHLNKKSRKGPSRSREGMDVPFNPIANRRREIILNFNDGCGPPIFRSLQVRDCILGGLLTEHGKAINIRKLLSSADSEN